MGTYMAHAPLKSAQWNDYASSTHQASIHGESYIIGRSTLAVAVGNLADFVADGLVCYASSSLALHSVVASRLIDVGGSTIRTECAKHLPAQIGDAVVISAGKLAARYLLVGVTNHIKAAPTLASIRNSIEAVLQRADQLQLRSLALPTIRVNKQIAADDALLATLAPIVDHLSGTTCIQNITLAVDDPRDFPLLTQDLPACLKRLSNVARVRATAQPLATAERMLAKTAALESQLTSFRSQRQQLVQRQLELQHGAETMLLQQQEQIGTRWQASHQEELERTQHTIAQLHEQLQTLHGPGDLHEIGS